jgi:hypothetical protein
MKQPIVHFVNETFGWIMIPCGAGSKSATTTDINKVTCKKCLYSLNKRGSHTGTTDEPLRQEG